MNLTEATIKALRGKLTESEGAPYFSYVAKRDIKSTLDDLLSGKYDIMYDYNVDNFVSDLQDYLKGLNNQEANKYWSMLQQGCISAENSNRRMSGTQPKKLIQALKATKDYLDGLNSNIKKENKSNNKMTFEDWIDYIDIVKEYPDWFEDKSELDRPFLDVIDDHMEELERDYKKYMSENKKVTEASLTVDEILDEYKKAYGKDLDLKTVPCVIARDKMLSGWGGAEGKNHYQVVLCGDREEAENIEYNMQVNAKREQLANVRLAFGIKSLRLSSVSYVVGRNARAWNMGDKWYERYDNKTETKNIKVKNLRKIEGIKAVEEYEYEFDDLYDIVGENGKSALDDIRNADKIEEFMDYLISVMSEDDGRVPTVGEVSDFIDYDFETIFDALGIKSNKTEARSRKEKNKKMSSRTPKQHKKQEAHYSDGYIDDLPEEYPEEIRNKYYEYVADIDLIDDEPLDFRTWVSENYPNEYKKYENKKQENLVKTKKTESNNDNYNKAVELLSVIFDINSSDTERSNAKAELDKLIQGSVKTEYTEPKFDRTIVLDKDEYDLLNSDKFRLKEEYRGFGIYQEVTPSGYYTSQYYLITNKDVTVVSQSYNNLEKDDMKDLIDTYLKTGKFNVKAIDKNGVYFIHNSGNVI